MSFPKKKIEPQKAEKWTTNVSINSDKSAGVINSNEWYLVSIMMQDFYFGS